MTVIELDTNRAAVNVSDGAGHRDICFFHFASVVASTTRPAIPFTPDQSVVTSRKKQSGAMGRHILLSAAFNRSILSVNSCSLASALRRAASALATACRAFSARLIARPC
jgi:hypothetical protein